MFLSRRLIREITRRRIMSGKASVAWLQQPLEVNDPEVLLSKCITYLI